MARWQIANVLNVGADSRHLWQFSTGGEFPLTREYEARNGEPLPAHLVAKNWRALFQPRLNVAWLPSDKVFLRVLQLPAAEFSEMVAMVELQLEKLSPLPVAQIVWTIEVLPQRLENLQNIIVVIAPRSLVEEFLGQLEGQGYLADRLEVPALDQLLATRADGDGVWIYAGDKSDAPFLVAWQYGGLLRNVSLLSALTEADSSRLKDHLAQMGWAGELEGWLTSPPRWHFIGDAETAAKWEPVLREWSEQPVTVLEPVTRKALAAMSARRAAQASEQTNLVPADFRTRYHQQHVDRLWMRGLGAIIVLYVIGVVIYLTALYVVKFQVSGVEKQIAGLSLQYTNTAQLKQRVEILEEQANLKYAALDCWKEASDLLPQELTLTQLVFQGGKKLMIYGTVPQEQSVKLTDYYELMSKVVINGQRMALSPLNSSPARQANAGAPTISWSFVCEIRGVDILVKKGGRK